MKSEENKIRKIWVELLLVLLCIKNLVFHLKKAKDQDMTLC